MIPKNDLLFPLLCFPGPIPMPNETTLALTRVKWLQRIEQRRHLGEELPGAFPASLQIFCLRRRMLWRRHQLSSRRETFGFGVNDTRIYPNYYEHKPAFVQHFFEANTRPSASIITATSSYLAEVLGSWESGLRSAILVLLAESQGNKPASWL